jgi:hypothetical protein
VNSHERKMHKRALKNMGVIPTPKPESKPPETKTLPRPLRIALNFVKSVKAVVVAVSVLLSYVVLKPAVAIEPYATRDPQRAFSEQFYIQNNNFYDVYDVKIRCEIRLVSTLSKHGTFENVLIDSPNISLSSLAAGAKATIVCPLDRLSDEPYGELKIAVGATYRLPFWIKGCKMSNFDGKSAVGGTYIWTFQGSAKC